MDDHNLFNGSIHAARKVANQELQGSPPLPPPLSPFSPNPTLPPFSSFFLFFFSSFSSFSPIGLLALFPAAEEGEVSLPLMALVDYRGYRVIATCLLPVSPSTLIYGSADGGMTAYAKNEEFNR